MTASDSDTLHLIALSLTKGMNAEIMRRMMKRGISPEEFMRCNSYELMVRLGTKERTIPLASARSEALELAKKELQFVRKNGIKALAYGSEGYPKRLLQCYDAPVVLYVLGNTDLDSEHILSIVGTRSASIRGVQFVSELVTELEHKGMDPVIISGLAYGIDTSAHEAALKNNLPTIAVVAHGLDTIYPTVNRNLARDIIRNGGSIVSEYPSATRPYRQRFLERNRIVAGLSDVTLIAESKLRGGAMSTARIANDYNRLVGAVPGRYNDELSEGCNYLIFKNIAALVSSADQLVEMACWKPLKETKEVADQPDIFAELDDDKRKIYEAIDNFDNPASIDSILSATGLTAHILLPMLAELEFDDLIIKYPGNKYSTKS